MRLRIAHEITTEFEPALTGAVRKLRMSPRTYDGQYVDSWRIDVDQDCRLDRIIDSYGNVIHNFSLAGPVSHLSILATGEVEVDDTAGVLQAGLGERLPPALYLRGTRLTAPDSAILDLAARCRGDAGADQLDACHRLNSALHEKLEAAESDVAELTGAVETGCEGVVERGRASAAECAHVFVAAARVMGLPARFVSGYLWRGDARDAGKATHAWAEVFIAGLGWVGFDPHYDRCPTDAYVRICASLDQNGAAYVRGFDHGVGESHVTTRAIVTQVDF